MAVECPQFEKVLSLIIITQGYGLNVMLYVRNINQYESDVYPCRCICAYNSIIVNSLAPINKRNKN